ncbi:tripartite tricarboxylate transporter substrate-binding protein [Rhodovarius sp.]|uniref:Bug family tripartite tricarboxylate transporter substrate binding protein n=1 Tax=Rhodovarius sp. TaxID=2972673 RepID=UPI003340E64D
MKRRSFFHSLSLTLAAPMVASAQPGLADRPIRLIVPVAPGGSQDIVARLLARHMAGPLGQSIVVENHPGAGSNIGYEIVARARPDGLTLAAGSDSLSINKALFPRLGFDPVEDFAPVAQATQVPQILVVRADSPAEGLAGFVELAKRQPLAVGTPGNGSLSHLLQQVVQDASEVEWTHVPYRGGALAVNDLMSGALQGVMINIGAVTEHVRAGRLRGIVVSSPQRTPALPQVKTFHESGLAHAEAVGWHGLVAPRGTPADMVARLHAALVQTLAVPELQQRLAALGIESTEAPPEALGARMVSDAQRWGAVVRRAGLRPD